MTRVLARALVLMALILAAAPPAAHAGLERVGPVTPATGGYPAWYQDQTGLALEFCMPTNQAELNGGWCTILPADVPTGAAPETPFTNFSEEHFYWIASAGRRQDALLVTALEGAFSVGPAIAGDQIVFGRLRITIASMTLSGDYKIYTPFGIFNFPGQAAGDRLFFTSDIGITCGTSFDCALNSQIGPFLLPSPFPGGPEVPPIPDLTAGVDPWHDALVTAGAATPYPANGKKYISDPARVGPVTGGSCLVNGTTCVMGNAPGDPVGTPARPVYVTSEGNRDPNIFRIEVTAGGTTTTYVEYVNDFVTGGRVMTSTIPSKVTVNRASYAAPWGTYANKLDVFASAFAAFTGRVPAAPVSPAVSPDLGVYPAPCATDPVTGAVTGPPTGTGLQYYQMFNDGVSNWWAQMTNLPAIPAQVCVQDQNARNAGGTAITTYFMGEVTDAVKITLADWDPATNGGTLTVQAASSDAVSQPTLTVSGYDAVITGGTVSVGPLGAPPTKVTVVSSRGGVASLDTTTGVGTPVSPTTPVANADSVAIDEDCSPTAATICATPPPPINVLANDTLNGGALPAGATVAISAAPLLGTATVDADQNIVYTPKANKNGTDIVGYKVTANGFTSNEGYLTVIIRSVNDLPIAVNDTAGAPNNKPVTLSLLANDTDPDGAADLAAAVIVTVPAAGATLTCNGGAAATAGTVCAGGSVTFTPTATGSFQFTYKAQDQAGAQSVTAATVTVTVNATEAIGVQKSQYVISKNRWVVSGTDSVIAGQTLTIAYSAGANGGTYKVNGVCTGSAAGTLVSTVPVDALGNWVLDATMTSAGVLNPSNTGGNSTGFWCTPPKSVTITSPLGGTATANITLK